MPIIPNPKMSVERIYKFFLNSLLSVSCSFDLRTFISTRPDNLGLLLKAFQ